MNEYIITYESGKESEVTMMFMSLDIKVEKVIKATNMMVVSTDMFRLTRLEQLDNITSVEIFETE